MYATVQQSQALKTQCVRGGPHSLTVPSHFPDGSEVTLDRLHQDIERIRQAFPDLHAEIQTADRGQHTFTFTTPKPLTLRHSEGRRFRMYARTVTRHTHKDLKVGVIVIRGLQRDVQESRPRLPRSDQKKLLFTLGPLRFYQ
ncbi:hypothetical protein [Deinococcus cellulosilyticus]|uniref:Uncharacterized protein n=1 Tax=Deinococcus cellulosilyticus (strain DSM 18568 / NBRC 106333 / KACC 11606 / 5516J-15) TaxID=1223518 RepID=A0A511NA77_DEIC1|nr:hypothetical protein [Deinococcus cellulosilyticus]GEM49436.1 hypothetical protein DC3_50710 [Deinococcus cellulosilyticus NBRC 106333 = KACC 11606]